MTVLRLRPVAVGTVACFICLFALSFCRDSGWLPSPSRLCGGLTYISTFPGEEQVLLFFHNTGARAVTQGVGKVVDDTGVAFVRLPSQPYLLNVRGSPSTMLTS